MVATRFSAPFRLAAGVRLQRLRDFIPSSKSLRKDRLEEFISSWPNSMAGDLRLYLRDLHRRASFHQKTTAGAYCPPYWIPLPRWLAKKYRKSARSPNIMQRFISDVIWGQYCLFLFVRIQDDLYDGQAEFPSLIYASDQFLFEAEAVFSRYFTRTSPFWGIYRHCLRMSTRAIVQVDRLQRSAHAKGGILLEEYAEVASIFKIASSAVCIRARRMKDFVRLVRLADELAKASQILDDLEDVLEDLERKRFNYASVVLLQDAGKRMARRDPAALVAESLWLRRGLKDLLSEVRRHLTRAQKAIEPLGIAEMNKYLADYGSSLDRLEADLHRERVRIFFKGIPHSKKDIHERRPSGKSSARPLALD